MLRACGMARRLEPLIATWRGRPAAEQLSAIAAADARAVSTDAQAPISDNRSTSLMSSASWPHEASSWRGADGTAPPHPSTSGPTSLLAHSIPTSHSPSCHYAPCGRTPGTSPAWLFAAAASHASSRRVDSSDPWPFSYHQTRSISSSLAASAGTKSATKAKASGAGAAAAASAAAAAARQSRTPEWARVPAQQEDLQDLFRKRQRRMVNLRKQAQTTVEELEARSWRAGAGGRAAATAARAALEALPTPPPEDGGQAELAAATAAGASFAQALASMTDLLRRGVVLDASAHLAPLLRKATSAADLESALELLRRNHLAQAAARLGAHAAQQGSLHGVLLQECQRLGTAAPLVAVWESVYEHGMEPAAADAAAAVRCAVTMGEGRAAVSLLSLSSQYGEEPLAAAEAGGVLALLEAGNPDEAAQLRELLPKLGIRTAAAA